MGLVRSQQADRGADSLALEAHVASAGSALACVFSSSAELDAAIITARRAAGVYGPRKQRRQILVTATAVLAALLVLVLLIV